MVQDIQDIDKIVGQFLTFVRDGVDEPFLLIATEGWQNFEFDDSAWQKPQVIAQLGAGPWATKVTAATVAAAAPLKQPTATPIEIAAGGVATVGVRVEGGEVEFVRLSR